MAGAIEEKRVDVRPARSAITNIEITGGNTELVA